MSTEIAHKRWWETFEVICGIPFLAAIGLQFAVPRSLPRGPAVIAVGAALVMVGTALVIFARRELASRGQPTDPGRPTTALVETGAFSISRNPLYLGGFCILTGIALAFNLFWAILSLPLALIACHYLLIVPEERLLAGRFGAQYRSYAASVRRWLGRTGRQE